MAEHVVGAIRNAWRYQESQDKVKELQAALDERRRGAQETPGRIREQSERASSLSPDSEEAGQRARAVPEPSAEEAGLVVGSQAGAERVTEQEAMLQAAVIQGQSDLELHLSRHEEQFAHGPVE
jgi:hypothetical protein